MKASRDIGSPHLSRLLVRPKRYRHRWVQSTGLRVVVIDPAGRDSRGCVSTRAGPGRVHGSRVRVVIIVPAGRDSGGWVSLGAGRRSVPSTCVRLVVIVGAWRVSVGCVSDRGGHRAVSLLSRLDSETGLRHTSKTDFLPTQWLFIHELGFSVFTSKHPVRIRRIPLRHFARSLVRAGWKCVRDRRVAK